MSASANAITRFVRYLTLGELAPRARVIVPDVPRLAHSLSDREIYSYGRHFPLARYVPARGNVPALWVINGDRWRANRSTATHRHQDETRTAIATAIEDAAKLGKRVRSIIVPFSALAGADIAIDSIRPIHVRDDRRETFRHTAKLDAALFARPIPTRESCELASRASDPRGTAILGSDTLASSLRFTAASVSDDTGLSETYTRTAKLTRSIVWRGYDYSHETLSGQRGAYIDHSPAKVTTWLDGSDTLDIGTPDDDGSVTVTWQSFRHWLGDSLFSAKRNTQRVSCPVCHGTGTQPDAVTVTGREPSCEHCHGSGRVNRDTARMRYLSSFDYNERAPLYFLAALPRTSRATSVDMALDDLAPAAVHAAYARGLDVKRQGDIFAIPTRYTDADIDKLAHKRARLHTWTHAGNAKHRPGEVGYIRPMTARESRAAKRMRAKLFRESMARNMAADIRPSTSAGYRRDRRAKRADILATLARHETRVALGEHGTCTCDVHAYSHAQDKPCETCGKPVYYRGYTYANAVRGIEQARASLAAWHADSERVTNRMSGYASSRPYRDKHGKCYSRAISAWQDAKRNADMRYRRTPIERADVARVLAIYGTAHTATEVVTTRTGATYVRGVLRHVPGIDGQRWRERDHAPVKLDGAVWYVCIRNTVPRA